MQRLPKTEPAAWLAEALDGAAGFDVEHHVLLTNHLTHGLIALAYTGAGRDDADVFRRRYLGQLDEPHPRHEGGPDPARQPAADDVIVDKSNWRDLVNDRRNHHAPMRSFFAAALHRDGTADTIASYVPPLLPGLAGAALHPIIHCGLAVEADNQAMLADGLAYMATMQQRLGVSNGPVEAAVWAPGTPDMLGQSLRMLHAAKANGDAQIAFDASLRPEYQSRNRGLFQQRVMAFNDDSLPLGRRLDDFGPLELPSVEDDLGPAVEQAVVLSSAAFLASSCEFFVLHALTSLHSLLVVMPMLAPDQQRCALAYWWRAAMATIVVQGLPGLDRFEAASFDANSRPVEWAALHQAARPSHDEHVQKAVFALWRWATSGIFSDSTIAVCAAAASHQVRATRSGQVHDNVWFAWSGREPPN